MKSLIVVGSAPLEIDLARFIDACDCVVRFNNCKNYGGNSGSRTDVLFLSNSDDPANHPSLAFMLKKRTSRESEQELPYLTRAGQVWFIRPPSAQLTAFLKNDVPDTAPLKKQNWETTLMAETWPPKSSGPKNFLRKKCGLCRLVFTLQYGLSFWSTERLKG